MSDLSEFLLARITEDESTAQEARGDELAFSSVPPYGKLGGAAGDLARRFRPARVLAECDAKRRIVDYFSVGVLVGESSHARVALRLLALPYADHPDYRPEWRP